MNMLVKDDKDGIHKFFAGKDIILNFTKEEGLALASYFLNQIRTKDSVHRDIEIFDDISPDQGCLTIFMSKD